MRCLRTCLVGNKPLKYSALVLWALENPQTWVGKVICNLMIASPQGTEVFPLLGSVLCDPEVFEQPEEFNPDRFLDADGRFQKQEAFLPFSLGTCWAGPCSPAGSPCLGVRRADTVPSPRSLQVSVSASGRAWHGRSSSSFSPPSCSPSPWTAHAHRGP